MSARHEACLTCTAVQGRGKKGWSEWTLFSLKLSAASWVGVDECFGIELESNTKLLTISVLCSWETTVLFRLPFEQGDEGRLDYNPVTQETWLPSAHWWGLGSGTSSPGGDPALVMLSLFSFSRFIILSVHDGLLVGTNTAAKAFRKVVLTSPDWDEEVVGFVSTLVCTCRIWIWPRQVGLQLQWIPTRFYFSNCVP